MLYCWWCGYGCIGFFFNDTATTEIYTYGHTLSLHDALPILAQAIEEGFILDVLTNYSTYDMFLRVKSTLEGDESESEIHVNTGEAVTNIVRYARLRSEEHTSELQSLMPISYAVFCLKKKNNAKNSKTKTNAAPNTHQP